MRVAGQIDDRPHRDARRLQVDDQLRQARVPILAAARGAEQRDHIVAVHRVGGPDLLPVDAPAGLGPRRAGADACEVGSRPRLAHPDAEEQLAAADARDIGLPLLLGPEIEDQRRALPVGDPVRRDRRPCRQQFLHDHKAREGSALVPAIALGEGQPQKAGLAQPPAERGIEPRPRPGAAIVGQRRDRLGDERADRGTDRFVFGRQRRQGQCVEQRPASRIVPPVRPAGGTLQPRTSGSTDFVRQSLPTVQRAGDRFVRAGTPRTAGTASSRRRERASDTPCPLYMSTGRAAHRQLQAAMG